MKPIIIALLCCFIYCFSVQGFSAQAKVSESEYDKYMKDMPVYPKAKIYDLKKIIDIKMKLYITEEPFEKVMIYYVEQMEKKGWKIEFPSPLELKIWFEALDKDKSKTPNIMLSLINSKTKLNCNITIGVVKDARYPRDLTIITIYLTDTMLR